LFGHLFWELGDLGSNVSGDTLRIELLRPTFGRRSVVLTSCKAVTVDMQSFGLGDQTFVRNTGNFTHAFVGEGGTVSAAFARVFAYSAKDSLRTRASACSHLGLIPDAGTDDQDFGMPPGVPVSAFISNTAERMVFAASPDTSVVAFDTYFFNQQKRIKTRDPIIGPLRVAKDSVAGQPATQLLFGITTRGLVVITLPTITNINPQAPPVRR